MESREPEQVLGGRYRVESRLGRGGFGVAWAAYDEVMGTRVAIEPLGAGDAQRLRHLTHMMRRLGDHPNLVPMYDVVADRGVLWGVRALVQGPTLAEYAAERGRLPEQQVREIARILLDVLETMHAAGVVHGDVRPANIQLNQGSWMLLPPLRPADRESGETIGDEAWRTGEANMACLAPELLSGAPLSPSSDLFSLGAALHQLLSGQPPFERNDIWSTLQAVLRDDPPPLHGVGVLSPLVEGLLDKNPRSRMTIDQARALLDGRGEDSAVGPVVAWTALSRSNHTLLAPRSLLALLVLGAALAWAAARVPAAQVSGLLVPLLPWAVFAAGIGLLAVQIRTALTRGRAREPVPLWQRCVHSLAPPDRWTDEERARRRAAAELALDEALLKADQRLASTSGGTGKEARDV